MRKILLGLLLLIVLLAGLAVALPFFLPREMIKAEVERRVTAELGREFRIEGPLTFRPWRPFAVTMEDVRLANPDWAAVPELARIDRVELEVDALAYLDGTIALERLVIEQPVLALERQADGRASWQLGEPGATSGDRGSANQGSGDGAGPRPDVRIGEVRITGGTAMLDDRLSGETRRFEAIELWVRSDPASAGLLVDASVEGEGERATLRAAIGDLNGLLAGQPSGVELELDLPGVGLVADGEASPTGTAVLAITGEASPRVLMDWLGQPLDMPAGTLEAVRLSLDLEAAPSGLGLRGLNLVLDELEVRGDLELALGARPALSGRLDLGALDLVPYLPADDGAAAAEDPAATPGPSEGWPEEPLGLPLPLPIDLDLELVFDRLTTPDITLGAGRLLVEADAAATALQIEALALYDGTMTGRIALGNGAPVGLEARLDAQGVQLQPLLDAVADIDRFAGTGNLQIAVTSEGESVAALMRNLAGEGAVLARDGAILGINIAATIRQVTSLGAVSAAAEPQRTDFAEAGGTFRIEAGVLSNEDFALRAPVLRVTGAGTVDLGARTLDYRLQPRLAATLQGQDAAAEGAFQAGVPLVVRGPWADPAIRLDMAGVLSEEIGDPAALGAVVRDLANDPARLENLRDRLGIDPASGLGEALQGLGGLLGGRAPAAPAAGADGPPAETPEADEPAAERPADPVGRALESLGNILGR